MAVIINTSSKVVDKFGAGQHGFTNGNSASGIPPTQLDSDYFDAVSNEINSTIIIGGVALNGNNSTQLGVAIETMFGLQYSRYGVWDTQVFRMASLPNAIASDWLWRRRLAGLYQRPANSVQTWCNITPPDNSQSTFEYRISCVGTDAIGNYGNIVIMGSARKTGGVVSIQMSTNVHSDVPLAGLALTVVASSGTIAARATIPAAPAGKVYNMSAHGVIVNTTQ